MKINKILAAGMAATLAVTSLSAVVSAETVTKTFDMATSVGTLTIKQEGTLGVDFLASIVGNETIRSPKIVAPAKDGSITIDFSNAVFYAPYNKGANTLKIANGDFDITGVKLVVTGIQGGKNNTSKDYEYAFSEDSAKTDKFTLEVNKSEGKGFIPKQFVEITKVKYVIEAKFLTENKAVYESAKDGNDATWGGTLENYTVTTDLDTDGKEKSALYDKYLAAKAELDAAQKAYDALLALYNGQSKQLSDAEIEAAKAELIKLVGANWKKLVGINDSNLDSNADLAGTLKTLITKMNGVEAGTSKISATDTDLKGTAYETAVNAYFAYYKEDLTLPETQPADAEAAAAAGVKTLANWIVEFNRQIATIQSDIEVANNNIEDAKARMEQAREALKQADPAITFDENGTATDAKGNKLDGTKASKDATGETDVAPQTVVRDYVDANATYQQYRKTIAEGPSNIAELEGKLNKVSEKQTALKENIAFERNIILKTYYQLKKVLEERAGATKVSVTDDELATAKALRDAAETAAGDAYDKYLAAPSATESNTDSILGTIANVKKIMGGWDATHFWVGYNEKSIESRYGLLWRTTTNTTIGRTDVKKLSYTGAHGSDNIWSDGYSDYANQSYSGDDVTKGTAPRQFAGLASQAADFFNKRNNGKITFKFTAAASSSSGWVSGGVPSTEVGLKSSLAGSNFGMFWNYDSSTGQLISLGQVDSDALTVTFDISQILDDMGTLTKGNLTDIYYGLNTGINYGKIYGLKDDFVGYLVEQIIFSYDDAASETDADVETVAEDDDTDTDTETVVDEDDDDDDDDYIVDEDDDDDDAAAIVDEDDDEDDAPAVIVSDDKDDTDTNNDVVIVTPVKEDDDANPGTGVGLAVIPAIVAAAAMVVSKKRK